MLGQDKRGSAAIINHPSFQGLNLTQALSTEGWERGPAPQDLSGMQAGRGSTSYSSIPGNRKSPWLLSKEKEPEELHRASHSLHPEETCFPSTHISLARTARVASLYCQGTGKWEQKGSSEQVCLCTQRWLEEPKPIPGQHRHCCCSVLATELSFGRVVQ